MKRILALIVAALATLGALTIPSSPAAATHATPAYARKCVFYGPNGPVWRIKVADDLVVTDQHFFEGVWRTRTTHRDVYAGTTPHWTFLTWFAGPSSDHPNVNYAELASGAPEPYVVQVWKPIRGDALVGSHGYSVQYVFFSNNETTCNTGW
jgi:hypothetical protein